jgi:glycosyltransferase involved in cell wall biosynthesis
MLPLISIVMPLLNQERFLPDALKSVLEQSYKNLELLVVDGGSTDGSLDILKDYSNRDSRLKWITGKDSGPAQAVNRAVLESTGEIIGWLNADDLLSQDSIAETIKIFKENSEYCMVYGHAENIDPHGVCLGRYPTLLPSTTIQKFQDSCFICQPTVCFKRSAFDTLGGLDESLKTAFDFDLWIRFFKAFPRCIGFIDRVQARQRLHAESITSNNRETVALESVTILKKYLDSAPSHWLLTYLDELLNAYPEDGSSLSPLKQFEHTLTKARNCLGNGGYSDIQARLAKDSRLAFASDGAKVMIYEDGWAGPDLKIKLNLKGNSDVTLIMNCSNYHPSPSTFRLHVICGNKIIVNKKIRNSGEFQISIPLKVILVNNNAVELNIKCDRFFEPIKFLESRHDHRKLCYKLLSFQLISQSNTQTGLGLKIGWEIWQSLRLIFKMPQNFNNRCSEGWIEVALIS